MYVCLCVCEWLPCCLDNLLPFLFLFALGAKSGLTPTQEQKIRTEGGRRMTSYWAFHLTSRVNDTHGSPTCFHLSGSKCRLIMLIWLQGGREERYESPVSYVISGSGWTAKMCATFGSRLEASSCVFLWLEVNTSYLVLFNPYKNWSIKMTNCSFTGFYVLDYFLAGSSNVLKSSWQLQCQQDPPPKKELIFFFLLF